MTEEPSGDTSDASSNGEASNSTSGDDALSVEAATAADEADAERALIKKFYDDERQMSKRQKDKGKAAKSQGLGEIIDRAKQILNGG